MIDSLPLFHRIAGQPVVVLGSGEAAEAKRRLVERAGGVVIDDLAHGIEQGARLAFIAYDDDATGQAAADDARAAGLLVNVTDRPALCDFTVPSILDRSPVLLAIGTGGASAGLAKQLRLRLEQILPASVGMLASALYDARAQLRVRFPDAAGRRRALDAALAPGGALDPLADTTPLSVARWLRETQAATADEIIEIVLRSYDPDDLTLREARLLGTADIVAFESGVGAAILDRARADARRIAIEPGTDMDRGAGLAIVLRAPL